MRTVVSKLFGLFGYEVQGQWRIPKLAAAKKIGRMFDLLDIEYVFDVGANVGQYRNFLRADVGFRGTIHSFEPVPALIETLKQRQITDTRWFVHPYALGSETCQKHINVMASPVFSSFHQPNNEVIQQYSSGNTVLSTECVTVRQLDDVIREISGVDLSRTFLKLDTQGFDIEVLKGGRSTLSQIPALQTEVSFQPIYYDMPNVWESILAFGEVGFAVSDFFLVSEDKNLVAVEFDCVMVRRRR